MICQQLLSREDNMSKVPSTPTSSKQSIGVQLMHNQQLSPSSSY